MEYKEETRKVYDQDSEYFDQKFGEYVSDFINDELEDMCSMLPKEAKILDLGSGTGNQALFLKNKGFDVLCLDISEKMIQKCEDKGLKTLQADFEKTSFPKSSFDVVWAYTSLLHTPKENMPNLINKISSFIKKDGLFILSLKEGTGESFVDFKNGGRRWFSLYKNEEIINLLKDEFGIIKNWRVSVGKDKFFLDYLCKKIT